MSGASEPSRAVAAYRRPDSLGDRAYRAVKQLVFSGELKPGQFVSQRELAQRTGASLAPIRETLQRLAVEGLVTIIPQRGVQIARIDPKRIRDAFQFRSILERAAVRHFSETATQAELVRLVDAHRAILERTRAGIDGDVLSAAQTVDTDLHQTVVRSTGNDIVWDAYSRNAETIRLVRLDSDHGLLTPQSLIDTMLQHLAISEACLRRDADAAEQAMASHIDIAMRRAMGL